MEKVTFPVPVGDFIPHKPPMALLRNIITHDGNSTLCDLIVETTSLFFREERVEVWVGLEYMAQAVAAHAGMAARLCGKPVTLGFLLGTRRADFFTEGYPLGQTLHVAVRHVWGEGELFSFDCSIADAADGRCLAAAQLNVFRGETV